MTDLTDLTELYQQVILDHNSRPRNYGPLEGANRHADGHNPLCGDHVTVHARLEDGRLADVRFEGSGCAISKASASLMTAAVKGKPAAEVEALRTQFQAMVMTDPGTALAASGLGKLLALAGVRAFPARVKCATLPWHTLRAALQNAPASVTTE